SGLATRRARISDIADRLGVSSATVSRAISGRGYVRADLAEKIRAVAVELNYGLPDLNVGRRVLLAASNDAMVDFQRAQFTTHVLDGLRQRAAALGIEIDQRRIDPAGRLDEIADTMREPDVTGTLLLTVDDALLDAAHALPGPVVLVNSDDPDMRLSSVTPCNRSAAALAAKHLTGLGHERILFLTKPGRRTIQRRLEGLRDVLGPRFDPGLVVEATDWTVEAAESAMTQALEAGLDFSAVLAAGDVLAAGALLGLHAAGLDVPKDVSLVGIDGLPQGEYLSPALTSVVIPMHAVGAFSLDLLLNAARFAGTTIDRPASRIELACTLAERDSTAAPGR
ncbi:MAG: LacI family DNA-binding transcriptional regulator, partial [Maritimibacter sp.]|nr:LacI family DNA-binding transcriptional regulator [Maritimibacter sp.]